MKSSNPVFARSAEFNGRGSATAANDPSQWQIDLDGSPVSSPTHTEPGSGRMTIDSVVEKTGLTLALLTVAAAVTWFAIGDVIDPDTGEAIMGKAATFAMAGALIGFVLAMVNSFKKVISPALVLAYAVFEGVFIGAFSKVIATYVGDTTIVFQAVLGTVIAFAGTLAAYKFFNIQVTDKFRKIMTISGFAIVGVLLVNMVLSMTGVFESGGLRGFNTLGLLVSCALVVYATFMLIMDFDYAEKGIEAGLPERESWRVAFGLTVTLVWLYIEILRILAILRGSD
jgi:uncharacterized YccA/Bax inhibitor family protein